MIRVNFEELTSKRVNKSINGTSVIVERMRDSKRFFGFIDENNDDYISIVGDDLSCSREWDGIELGAEDIYNDFKIIAEVDVNIEIDKVIKELK